MPSTLQRQGQPQARKPVPPVMEVRTLIDELLAEQSRLQTPAAKFAEYHDSTPALEPHYRSLIPLSKPGDGEQYAFEVALDRCTGCKACVSACHSLNGLDEDETWRDTGLLLGGDESPGWQQTITTACHHCEDPGCLNGCPVGAYEKEADTGIVRHLDDQCIGCSYCILKCPYDVPKYSKKRGIVRKCDMCHQRLAVGEAPACVQACPTEAIRIVKVSTAPTKSAELFEGFQLSPSAAIPDSSLTRPTTRYTGRPLPSSAYAADRAALIPQHAHWPLVLMLTLTQAGIGLISSSGTTFHLIGALLFYLGMGASVAHLGQPMKAWRFFLGLRTSWLSREILAFSIFAPLPFLWLILPHLPPFPLDGLWNTLIGHSIMPLGVIAIFTSVMIYHDTARHFWRYPRTAIRFFGTFAMFLFMADPLLVSIILLGKLGYEFLFLRHARSVTWTPGQRSARLQVGPLRKTLCCRFLLAGVAIPAAFVSPWLALPLLLAAEIGERLLFFRSVDAPKMPGGIAR